MQFILLLSLKYLLRMGLNILTVFIIVFSLTNSFTIINMEETKVFVTFTATYPDDKLNATDKLYMRGDNCDMTWEKGILMAKASPNKWNVTLACPKNTTVQFKILLNDKIWQMGANEWFSIPERQNYNLYPSFHPNINKFYDTENVFSVNLKNSRKCSIYLPPSYHDNTLKKYPVLFMHDGQNLFEDSKAAFGTAWKIQDSLNDMIFRGQIEEMIVIGIWNTNDRVNEYTYSYYPDYKSGGKGDLYLDFIQKELLPEVRDYWFAGRIKLSEYSIAGSSLGGLISCYALYTRPSTFRKAICMSSSFWWNRQDFDKKVISTKYDSGTKIYIDSGDQGDDEDGKDQTLTVKAHLQKIGYQISGKSPNLFYYLDKGGQHNEYFWGRRFHIPLKAIYNAQPPKP